MNLCAGSDTRPDVAGGRCAPRAKSSNLAPMNTSPNAGRARLGAVFFACAATLAAAASDKVQGAEPAPAAAAAAVSKIDLNAFDATKKSVALPDGETLAYIEMGPARGTAVVLIHGYTDSA